MQKPRITVLMPVYNAEKFLKEAIESVLQQSFTDFEFLILDDGSSDRSIAIIQSYADPRIRFYQNETNMGISATLNKGIGLAATDLIARMDADDLCYPHRLQEQYDYLAGHPECAMVSSGVRVVTEDGSLVRQDDFKSEYYYYNLTFECWIYHPTIVFRRQAADAVGRYTVRYSEDFELFWQLSRKFKIYTLPQVLLDYRVTSQSLHQVQKKTEYEVAQHEQVERNIRHYVGKAYPVPPAYIECLRHNFLPLLQQNSVGEIVKCFNLLEDVTKKILADDNPNLNPEAIRKAAHFKKAFILNYYVFHLPRRKGLLLIVKMNAWDLVTKIIKNRLKRIHSH